MQCKTNTKPERPRHGSRIETESLAKLVYLAGLNAEKSFSFGPPEVILLAQTEACVAAAPGELSSLHVLSPGGLAGKQPAVVTRFRCFG